MKGNSVPNVTFKVRVRDESIGGDNPFKWTDVTTHDIFSGKRVVVFSLPGAFTDEIYVISVNDTFVMRKWMIDQGVEKIKFIPDGNGEFTEKMGMLVCKDNLGFGSRSWRYAMVVDNGIVEQFWEEPGRCDNADDDPYGETDPNNVLEYLRNN